MIVKAPISVCIIVKNEPLLEECVKSIRDYVQEVVIVDTGSTDGTTAVTAKRLADKFETFTECNNKETGLIEDFSFARQRSFDLATQPWVMWVDADDIITGGEALQNLTTMTAPGNDAIAVMFKYEYSYDEKGKCTCFHYRERLFSNKNKFHWVNPVHEVVVANDGVNSAFVLNDVVVYKHRRQYSAKIPESGRNLRILRNYFEKHGDSDPRQLYYLGLECHNNGLIEEAIQHLSKYVDVSGWDDERTMACLKLVEIFQNIGDYTSGLKWGMKAIVLKENWGEGYFAIGKMFYYLANAGGPNTTRNWERCIHFSRIGLALPPTKTLLFVNPQDREYDIHRYLSVALDRLGDVTGALESANTGLLNKPDDPTLLGNKKIYEVWLVKQNAIDCVNKLKNLEDIDQQTSDLLGALLHKQTTATTLMLGSNNSKTWTIPADCNTEELPIQISNDQLQSSIMMLWKQYMLHDEPAAAITFLENAPKVVRNMPEVQKALELTKRHFESISGLTTTQLEPVVPSVIEQVTEMASPSRVLDIVFFAGDGIEKWTPETVSRTGIGGSEMMLLEQARRLAALGHKVRVYNSCGFFGKGEYDKVVYDETNRFKDLVCDILVVSRRADMLGDEYNVKAAVKLLWVHDVCAVRATNELLLKADRILALSEWHKQNILKIHNIHPEHVIVTRNGIDLNRFNKQVPRNSFKCVNSSSPDRSWPILLDVWPTIKAAVPKAELHLYYGFKNWEYSAQFDKGQADLIVFLKNKIKEMERLGVVYHDRVSQAKLAEEFLSAGCWIHPTWFTETSCITAMEAQAAGLKIVTSSIAALNETVADRGILIDGDWTTPEYKSKFVKAVIESMNNCTDNDRDGLIKYAEMNFGLPELAKNWEKIFFDLITDVAAHPMRPYQPTLPYVTGKGYSDGDTRLKEDHPERRKV